MHQKLAAIVAIDPLISAQTSTRRRTCYFAGVSAPARIWLSE
jgi:hypothetical protein